MRERMELRTQGLAVLLTAAWPMVLGLALMAAASFLSMPPMMALQVTAVMAAVVALTLAICMRMYLGTYLFLPATEYKGARLIARLGRNETEIAGVCAAEIIVKQGFIEKALKVCHIRQKGTAVYLRGVPEPEKVRAWIATNFPEKTTVMRNQEAKASRKRKKTK